MQSFFNDNESEEKELIELANTIFETVINDLEYKSRYLTITPDLRESLRDTVYKLVKIASQQNELLLQFPAILAYFVYNFINDINLKRINDINEILDEIQRLIERKNLQGLSFSTIKQILQQELQEKKFGRNRPGRSEKQQEEKKQSGKGERQGKEEEGEQSEREEEEGRRALELGEENAESNEQEGEEKQGSDEGESKGGESGGEESQSWEEGGERGQELGEGEQGIAQEGEELGEEESESGEEIGGEEEENQGGEEGGEGEQKSGGEGNQGLNGEQGGEGSEGEVQEIEGVSEDLQKNIEEESTILDMLEESLQKALSALSIGKGSGGGMLNEVNPRVLELLERANRILALANQVDLQYANNRGVKDQGGVMKGITTGNNVKHMFKSQLILPDEIFLERYVNRALLQRAVENEGIGDFYFIIDKSGSMESEMPNGYTAFENVSAVALASAMEAEKNGRKVFVQYFDESTTEPIDVNDVFEIAQVEPGGGTDMMVALRRFMDYYNRYPGLKDVKQVFILSDFETYYNEHTLEDFRNFAKNNGLVVTCLHVYEDEPTLDMQDIIDQICDEYYKFNNYDASKLFSVVYSKV